MGAAAGAEWHVYPVEGTPIQTAIDGASEGDTVYVHEGEYCENVNIATAHLKLTDGGAGVVTVTAASSSDYVFEVTADWVNISGFKVSGATHCAGIYLNNTNHCYISDNAVSNNRYGICLDHSSSKNTLMGNNVSDNEEKGIDLWYSSNNTLQINTAPNNYYGIFSWYSSDNMLYHNKLFDNTEHNAYDTGTNTWDSGSAGNYYSDYNGTDPDGDGIGDDPYPIPGGGGSVDNYPLMQPWIGGMQQLGDLNGDNQITPTDAAIALAIAASGGWDVGADVSGDNCVTSLDALMILQECMHSKRVISS